MQTVTVNTDVVLVVEECCSCGVVFGITIQFYRQRHSSKGMFYCPNGHPQHYAGESNEAKAKRLEKELKETKRWQVYFEQEYKSERKSHEATQRSLSARKAVNTKLKNRIKKGLCPKCHEHFTDLQNHMNSQHPNYESLSD